MYYFDLFWEDFKITRSEFVKDLTNFINLMANEEIKIWYNEWKFVFESENPMIIGIPGLGEIFDAMWFSYDSIIELRNLKSLTYK